MHQVIMICGYMRTGKDEFYKNLIGQGKYKWRIYSKGQTLKLKQNYKRFAFADKLKEEVSSVFGISLDVKDKDKKQFEVSGEIVSARDLDVRWAAERKST